MPKKNIIPQDSAEPQVPKATTKRTLTPEQLANLARARQRAQELRRKARDEKLNDATREVVQEEIISKKKKEPEPEPEPEPELQEEEYLEPEVPKVINSPPPKQPEPPEIVDSANPLAKTIKQKKKIIFEDSGSEDESSEPIIVVRKKKEKKEKVLSSPDFKPQPVFYREAPMRPINPFQRHNADIYRR
jgi:hypothetical protein